MMRNIFMIEQNGRWAARIDGKCPLKIEPMSDVSFAEFVSALREDYPQCRFHKFRDEPLLNEIMSFTDMKYIEKKAENTILEIYKRKRDKGDFLG